MFWLGGGRPMGGSLAGAHVIRRYVSGKPAPVGIVTSTMATAYSCFRWHGHSLANTLLLVIPLASYMFGILSRAALLLPTAVILALCAASHGLPAAHISPVAGIMAIVQYRFGRLFVESIYIPTAVNIESLPLPGPL